MTGGGRGIGRAVAAGLAGAGACVTVLGRDPDRLRAVVDGGAAAGLGVPIDVVSIGPDCDYEDPFGDWARARGVADDGALLVRPDQVIAWRSTARGGDLDGALRQILGR